MLDVYEILNSLSELVYISDIETYELIFMNKTSLQIFGIQEDYKGKLCYKLLQGLDAPCKFCTNSCLKSDEFYNWEIYNNIAKTHYLLKDKLIEYNGKPVRFEIATDITEIMDKNAALSNLLAMDNLLINCVSKLHEDHSIQSRINAILQSIGEFLHADRVYIFEKDEDIYKNAYEWCNVGISSQMYILQNITRDLLKRWFTHFNRNECVILEDLEDIRLQSPDEYKILKLQDIKSLIAAPMFSDSDLIGFIGIDNPPTDKLDNSPSFFSTIGSFLASIIAKNKTEEILLRMSYRDTMTGLNNRNKFISDIDAYNDLRFHKLGVIYMDINGLKETNDTYGHIAGDRKLIRLSQILKSIFDEESIYRIGGDEFCVLCTPIDESAFNKLIAKLREFFANPNDCNASIGYQYSEYYCDINEIIKKADKMMYDSKKNYYENIPTQYRYRKYEQDRIS